MKEKAAKLIKLASRIEADNKYVKFIKANISSPNNSFAKLEIYNAKNEANILQKKYHDTQYELFGSGNFISRLEWDLTQNYVKSKVKKIRERD
jgi:hypothetical protein